MLAFAFLSVCIKFHVVLALVFLSVFMGSCVCACVSNDSSIFNGILITDRT